MDINTQNSSGMMNGIPPASQNEKKVGPIVGSLIIVLILIIAGLYFFGKKLNKEATTPVENTVTTPISTNTQPPLTATASQVDDVKTLQMDLDKELENVDYSF